MHFDAYAGAFFATRRTAMAGKTIHAAGGIVVPNGARPLIAIVQRGKEELWGLARGKLKRDESPLAGARREVVEETGHRVRVREFVGAITYRARGRPKVVQFWRMQAEANPSRDLMEDIMAVKWLPLSAAIRKLSYPLESLFLRNVGRNILRSRRKTRVTGHKSKPRHSPSTAHRHRPVSRARKSARTSTGGSRATMLQRVLGRLSP